MGVAHLSDIPCQCHVKPLSCEPDGGFVNPHAQRGPCPHMYMHPHTHTHPHTHVHDMVHMSFMSFMHKGRLRSRTFLKTPMPQLRLLAHFKCVLNPGTTLVKYHFPSDRVTIYSLELAHESTGRGVLGSTLNHNLAGLFQQDQHSHISATFCLTYAWTCVLMVHSMINGR